MPLPTPLSDGARLVRRTVEYWSYDNASTVGAALAFYCAFSLAPLLVIISTLAGWVIGSTAAYGQIGYQLNDLFGPATARILLGAVKSSQQTQGLIATWVSAVTLLISATTVFSALEYALETIWEDTTPATRGIRGWIRRRLLSVGFILALGFLLLVSLTVTTALATLRRRVAADHAAMVGVIGILDLVMSLLLVAGVFALIYRYMPARRLPWRVVLCGGGLTAALFYVGRWAIGLYLAHSTQPTAFGAAASFAALLLWLYYSAQIFLFGAEFTAVLGGLRREIA
ncbi:MAG TPA: YihY/virulence factor BrkB family protein [Steroidobacteraceae bacterium]|jgi:membrane protein|nr:YihY/virulence factor BrkB family protein [Steroidobacteraceae bacterium]